MHENKHHRMHSRKISFENVEQNTDNRKKHKYSAPSEFEDTKMGCFSDGNKKIYINKKVLEINHA